MKARNDDLLTMQEVADLTGLTLISVGRYRQRGTLPQPDETYGRTPLWRRDTITTWEATRRKRPSARKKGKSA